MARGKFSIVNDLGLPRATVFETLERVRFTEAVGTRREGLKVSKLHPYVARLRERLVRENPDVILLPLRGGEPLFWMLPKKLQKRAIMLNVSETLSNEGSSFEESNRMAADREIEKNRGKFANAKKVAIVDDLVMLGVQSNSVASAVKSVQPNAKVVLLALTHINRYGILKRSAKNLDSIFFSGKGLSVPVSWLLRKHSGGDKAGREKFLRKINELKMRMGP